MKIVQQDIKSIVPYEHNNRVHSAEQVTLIARSIKEFGFNQPIVVDEDNVILVGHGRLFAALELGLKTVPVAKKIGLSEVNKRAYRILDNKLQNDSTWDLTSLKLELDALEELDFELEPWGLDELRLNEEKKNEGVLKDLSEDLKSIFKLEIVCMSEGHQQELYEKFIKDGFECRILTL